ncbi:putative Mid2 domain-containing protein [Seiridium cardinale]
MTKSRGALRAWMLAAALSTSSSMAMSVRANALFARDDTCGDTTYSKCPQAGFPDNFCCKPNTSCIPLAGDTTVLCCPEGSDCGVIAPIVCNVQLQDASTNPQAVVKTTALTSELPKCGSNCCPFGYTCDQDQNCVRDQDQSKKPEGAAGASSTASTPASTSATTTKTSAVPATASATSTGEAATAAPANGEDGDPTKAHAEGANTSAIVGGVVGGVIFLIAAVIGVVYLVWRHRKEQQRRRASDQSFVSKAAMISNPIPQNTFTYGRSDFIARSNPSANSTPSQAQEAFEGAKSLGSRNSYNSYDSSLDRSGSQFEERSYHASAIVDSLAVESSAGAARRETESRDAARLQAEERARTSGPYETIDISFDDSSPVQGPVGRPSNQRDTTLTQWPGATTGSRR